ncbi:MAG: transglutaminase [Desulfurobacterium sp.]|nr:MAG: transglutaminase [Desulfurobacterium sp.]
MGRLLTAILFIVLFPLSVLAKDFGALILYDHSEVRFFPDGRKVWKEEKAVKILDKRGIKDFGEIVIQFSTEHQKLRILYAYTVLPDGTIVKPDKKAFNVVYPPFVSEAPIYSDLKYQTISMPAVTKGAVIKYAFVLETFKPYMKNEFWTTNFFQDEYPVKEATFKAYIPKGKFFKFKTYNMTNEEANPQVSEEGDYVVFSWKLENVPPIEKEPNAPPIGELAKKVVITSIKSWDEIAKWYSELAKEALEPDETLKKTVEEIVKGKKTQEEKVRAIYNFVAKNIRYVGMEFGINGYKPHKASEVLKNRYGDCKDHATLLIAMLKVIGVKGYPVLIPTLSKSNMDPEVPLPTAFNHEIAAIKVNGQFLYMDTTSDYVPFKYLPASDQGRNVLVVDTEKEKGTVDRTPVAPPSENLEGFKGNFSLSPSGELRGRFTFIYRGVYSVFERARLMNSTPSSVKRHVEGLASRVSPGFDVEEFKLSDYKDLNAPDVTIEIEGKDKNYGTLTSHFLLAKFPAPDYSRIVSLVAAKKRKYPYVVGYKMSKVSEVELKFPPKYKLYLKPENFFFQNRVGSFSIEWEVEESKVKMRSRMVLTKSVITPEEYRDLRNLFNTAVKTIRNQIVVLKKE